MLLVSMMTKINFRLIGISPNNMCGSLPFSILLSQIQQGGAELDFCRLSRVLVYDESNFVLNHYELNYPAALAKPVTFTHRQNVPALQTSEYSAQLSRFRLADEKNMADFILFLSQFDYPFHTAVTLDVQSALLNDFVADDFIQPFPERVAAQHANGNGGFGIWKRIRRPFDEQGKFTQKCRLQIIFLCDLPSGSQAGETHAADKHCAENPAIKIGRARK